MNGKSYSASQGNLYPGQNMFTNTLYGPFGVPLTSPPPYCQNCDCPGCRIHRERLRLEQERQIEQQMHRNRMEFMQRQNIGLDEALDDMKPGAIIPLQLQEKPGIVTEQWWAKHRWKFLFFWTLGFAAVLHLAMTCATRQV